MLLRVIDGGKGRRGGWGGEPTDTKHGEAAGASGVPFAALGVVGPFFWPGACGRVCRWRTPPDASARLACLPDVRGVFSPARYTFLLTEDQDRDGQTHLYVMLTMHIECDFSLNLNIEI